MTYEEAVERQRQDGGPRRFYGGEDEIDVSVARVTDEHGNPVVPEGNAPDSKARDQRHVHDGEDGRTFVHVNVRYCVS